MFWSTCDSFIYLAIYNQLWFTSIQLSEKSGIPLENLEFAKVGKVFTALFFMFL